MSLLFVTLEVCNFIEKQLSVTIDSTANYDICFFFFSHRSWWKWKVVLLSGSCSSCYAVSAEILEVADADVILQLVFQWNLGCLLKYFVLFVFICVVYNSNYLIFRFSMWYVATNVGESSLCGCLRCLKAIFQLFTSYLKPKPEITYLVL